MKRVLELTIETKTDKSFDIKVYEPESGEFYSRCFGFFPYGHEEFNADIGNEIYSWVSLMMDSMEEEEHEEDY